MDKKKIIIFRDLQRRHNNIKWKEAVRHVRQVNAARGSGSTDAMYVTRRPRDTLRDLPFTFTIQDVPDRTRRLVG